MLTLAVLLVMRQLQNTFWKNLWIFEDSNIWSYIGVVVQCVGTIRVRVGVRVYYGTRCISELMAGNITDW